MIVTVLWEDQRGVKTNSFGPHKLLLSCLVDELGWPYHELERTVASIPLRGNGNVRRELQKNIRKLTNSGPVLAILDHDQIVGLWKDRRDLQIPKCMTRQKQQLKEDAEGEYEIVFLVDNMESLTSAVITQSEGEPWNSKPTPEERDEILQIAVGNPVLRAQVLKEVPSFARLVCKVAERLAGASSTP